MTELQEFMLSISFGGILGLTIGGLSELIVNVIDLVRFKRNNRKK